MISRCFLLCVLAVAVAGCGRSASITASKEDYRDFQMELLDLHNNVRIAKGVVVLAIDVKLCDYAQKHAEKMASKNDLYHSSMSDLQDYCGAGLVGENIAWGQTDEKKVVESWMWSPMHRWNILGSGYKKVGFGMKEDGEGRKYWCTVFSD